MDAVRPRLRWRAPTRWAVVILWMGVIFALSAEHGTQSSGLSGAVVQAVEFASGGVLAGASHATMQLVVRKCAHFLAYLILGALTVMAWDAWPGRIARIARSTTVRPTRTRDATTRDATTRDTAVRSTAIRDTTANDAIVKDTPAKDATANDTIAKDTTADAGVVRPRTRHWFTRHRRFTRHRPVDHELTREDRAGRSHLPAARWRTTGQSLAGPVLLAIAYAASDEFHQTFVPGRSGRVTDVLIDTAGAVIGASLIALRVRWATRHRNRG